ncbi:MAG: hypothetical protein JWP97_2054 [Labilithrix sp.]|nr:hypothetical protein [Labilithrix sp.]
MSLVSIAGLGLGRDPGCGGGDSPSSGLNGPCTRNKDCGGELACREGVCTTPDGGAPDASAEDAADDGG